MSTRHVSAANSQSTDRRSCKLAAHKSLPATKERAGSNACGKYERINDYLYCDGHIVARPPGTKDPNIMTNKMYSTYEEVYQWYVDKGYFERKIAKYCW